MASSRDQLRVDIFDATTGRLIAAAVALAEAFPDEPEARDDVRVRLERDGVAHEGGGATPAVTIRVAT